VTPISKGVGLELTQCRKNDFEHKHMKNISY